MLRKKRNITGSVQVKNGKYWVVINLYDVSGKRKPKWIDTKLPERGNKRNAEKMLADYLADFNKMNIPYSKITVDEYFKWWLDEVKSQVNQNTYRSYRGNMMNHIIPYFEQNKTQLQELTPLDLEVYYVVKSKPHSKLDSKGTLSPTTIKHHHQNISKALADAVRKGLITMNPAANAKTPKAEKFKANFFNQSQIKEMLLLFKGSVIELPVFLTSVYGFRRSEVLGLKWSQIDFENQSIIISETLQQGVGGSFTSGTKTDGSYRTLPMTKEVKKVLLEKKKSQEDKKRLMGSYYIESDYVCTWEDGRVVEPNYLTRTFHSMIVKSDLPVIRFHDLRHSSASNLLNMGFSVVDVASWLGHSSSSTTLNFYAHIQKNSKMNIANALDGVFEKQSVR